MIYHKRQCLFKYKRWIPFMVRNRFSCVSASHTGVIGKSKIFTTRAFQKGDVKCNRVSSVACAESVDVLSANPVSIPPSLTSTKVPVTPGSSLPYALSPFGTMLGVNTNATQQTTFLCLISTYWATMYHYLHI